MINRLFKTIFILSICLGITLPSNAGSVQVSDGSAFITKSEFSYQLNSLSNRMAQLENSLDSKIDTLVSSYLTRNGIWNGNEQSTTNFSILYKDVLPLIKNAIITIAGRVDNEAKVKYDLFSWKVITKCSKDGLLFISNQCNHSWNYGFFTDNSGVYNHSIWQGVFIGYVEYTKKVSDDRYEILGATVGAIGANAEYYISNTACLSVAVPKSVFSTQVFVSKDDEITCNISLLYSGRKASNTNFKFNDPTYAYGCYIDTNLVGSATSSLANTNLIWTTNGKIY